MNSNQREQDMLPTKCDKHLAGTGVEHPSTTASKLRGSHNEASAAVSDIACADSSSEPVSSSVFRTSNRAAKTSEHDGNSGLESDCESKDLNASMHVEDDDGTHEQPELSPLAPKSLTETWSRTAGFAKQSGAETTRNDDALLPDGANGASGITEEVEIGDWRRRPGETSITYGVRLYMSNMDPNVTHEHNCQLLLRQILEQVAMEELDTDDLKMRHLIKIEAFLRSVILSVPAQTWRQSMKEAFAPGGGMPNNFDGGPQISESELLFRMTLFVAMMKAERWKAKAKGDEGDRAVDNMRVEAIVRAYVANAAEILPLQRPARMLLPPLLFCMACDILNVRPLGPEVRRVCRKIVNDYESRAKLWMSPAQNGERYLRPLVQEFASWLRTNHDVLFQESSTEGLLRTIDKDLRTQLKHQVYRSPEHFLSVLKTLKPRLTDTPLPPYDPLGGDDDHPFDISQTLKDVRRERFHVNGTPTEASQCWTKIRNLLFEAIEKNLTAGTSSETRHSLVRSEGIRGAQVEVDVRAAATGTEAVTGGHHTVATSNDDDTRDGTGATSATDLAAGKLTNRNSGTQGGTGSDLSVKQAAQHATDFLDNDEMHDRHSTSSQDGNLKQDMAETIQHRFPPAVQERLAMYADQCAWRVLHAASRTASGGDSYFVVQDLFGGDGVLVKIATVPTEPIRIRTKAMAARVTTVDKYDIYHVTDVDGSWEGSPKALMTITTTMKEVIVFASLGDENASRRKSWLTAESIARNSPQELARVQPSHSKSGRFLTISADIPQYPDDHLDASAGTLVADDVTNNLPAGGHALDAGDSDDRQTANIRGTRSGAAENIGGVSSPPPPPPPPALNTSRAVRPTARIDRQPIRRASVFNSPPPFAPGKLLEEGRYSG